MQSYSLTNFHTQVPHQPFFHKKFPTNNLPRAEVPSWQFWLQSAAGWRWLSRLRRRRPPPTWRPSCWGRRSSRQTESGWRRRHPSPSCDAANSCLAEAQDGAATGPARTRLPSGSCTSRSAAGAAHCPGSPECLTRSAGPSERSVGCWN